MGRCVFGEGGRQGGERKGVKEESYLINREKSAKLHILSLVPRPLPDFISQPWRKIRRRPGINTMSRTGNGGLG